MQKVVIVNGTTDILDMVQPVLTAGHYNVVFVESNARAWSHPVVLAILLAFSGLTVRVEAGHHSHSHSHSHSHPHSHSSGHSGHHWFSFFGHRIHRPGNSNTVLSGATAECNDGTYSFSESKQEACFNQGGVKRWLR